VRIEFTIKGNFFVIIVHHAQQQMKVKLLVNLQCSGFR
jgi:hypothetical protein